MQTSHAQSVAYAVHNLRLCVTACCWILGLSLIAQVVSWSLAAYTDLRYVVQEPAIAQPLVVTTEFGRAGSKSLTSTATSFADVIEPVAVRTGYDQFFNDITSVSMATGTLSCLVLLPLIMVSVILVASRPSGKVHSAVSAMVWTCIVAALALPLSGTLNLPWQDGAFHDYSRMVRDIDAYNNNALGMLSFFGRFLMLPLFCALGVLLIGVRFGRAVEALMPDRLPHQFDPVLEREAANRQAGTLHGAGRAAAALTRSVPREQTKPGDRPNQSATVPLGATASNASAKQEDNLPSARAVSPGKPLRRMI